MQVVAGKLNSLVTIAQQKYIKLIQPEDIMAAAELCGRCHEKNGFDSPFNLDATMGTIQAIMDKEEHLAVVWKEKGHVIGIGLFLLTTSITSVDHKKIFEVAWDVDPNIDEFKKGRVMVSLLNFMLKYYKGKADTAHFSIPCNNRSVRRYLFNKGFIPKEVCYVKELED